MSETYLKACPFCGGKATVYKAFPQHEYPWHISGDHDDVCILKVAHTQFECHRTADEAVEAWNRRSPATAVDVTRVTEEMVDAGVAQYAEGGCSGLDERERREVVRDILEAAIRSSLSPAPTEFKPCVVHYEEGDYSQMLLEDCAAVTGWPLYASPPAKAHIERLEEALKKSKAALEPLSDAVFNDNGDLSILSPIYPSSEQCAAAYFASKAIDAALSEQKGES